MESPTALATGLIVVLLLTSFVKMSTVLSLLRSGLGLGGVSFGVGSAALALALTLVVVEPQLKPLGGITGVFSVKADDSALEGAFRPFLEKHTEPKIAARIKSAAPGAGQGAEAGASPTFPVVIAGFLVSELKAAFLVGLMILIPFFIVDLLAANALAALDVSQISASAVSLPLKILLFFAVDGWMLVSEKLLLSYK